MLMQMNKKKWKWCNRYTIWVNIHEHYSTVINLITCAAAAMLRRVQRAEASTQHRKRSSTKPSLTVAAAASFACCPSLFIRQRRDPKIRTTTTRATKTVNICEYAKQRENTKKHPALCVFLFFCIYIWLFFVCRIRLQLAELQQRRSIR